LIEIIKRKILEAPGGLIFKPDGLFFEPSELGSEDMRVKIKR